MTTLTAKSPAVAAAGPLSALRRAFARWQPAEYRRQSQPEGVAELLARADAYDSTQPGFAADLRAAAERVLAAR